MNRKGNSLLGCKIATLVALMTTLTGCGSLQIKSAEASAGINVGFLNASVKVQIERKPSQESLPLLEGNHDLASALATDSRIDLSASNAHIPDQTTLATVVVKNQNGATIAAKTFVANVVSGKGTFQNPGQVETWFGSVSIPEKVSVSVSAPDIEIDPPQQGAYTATTKLVVSNQVLASATATGYISPGGGGNPPTHPNKW